MFKERFKDLLKARKTNAFALAKAICVPKSIVYEWIHGEREPSVENMLKVADHFGVSLEYLLGRTEEETDGERELLVLLREAKSISKDDHDALIDSFKANLNIYLKNSKRSEND